MQASLVFYRTTWLIGFSYNNTTKKKNKIFQKTNFEQLELFKFFCNINFKMQFWYNN